MIKEAVILAGGLGTRLRSVVSDLPKCMAPVAGKPFLHYVIKYFEKQGIERFVFSLGYKHELIEAFLQQEFSDSSIEYISSIEQEPLGTGGAILKAMSLVNAAEVLVLNGDTFFQIDLSGLSSFFKDKSADCVLALKQMNNSERYGVVDIDREQRITFFREKQFYPEGLINGGVYALNVASFLNEFLPSKFSFEKDYLETYCERRKFYGSVQDGYFIDIGIPEDFKKANMDFKDLSI